MKKAFTFFFIWLMIFPLSAQLADISRHESNIGWETISATDPDTRLKNIQEMWSFLPAANHLELAGKPAQMEQLDSVVFEKISTSEILWRRILTYDSKGRLSVKIGYDYDAGLNAWESIRDEYTYDTGGREILLEQSKWDNQTGQWVNWQRKSSTYNATHLTEIVYEVWNGNDWSNDVKLVYQYNASGIGERIIRYSWVSNQWAQSQKTEYAYDANDNMTESVNYQWNAGTNQWENFSFKHVFTYDASGNRETETLFYWNTATNQYQQETKKEYVYTSGLVDAITEYQWDKSNFVWNQAYKFDFAYDANDNVTEIIWSLWAGGQWNQAQKSEFTYDLNKDLAEVYYPKGEFNFGYFVAAAKPVNVKSYSYSGGNWTLLFDQSYYYSDHKTTGLKDMFSSDISVYPNPTSDYLDFNLGEVSGHTEVKVLDVTGKVVLEHSIDSENKRINVNELTFGVYIYQITGDNIKATGKFVVR